jgi:hypothetical protein
MGFFMGRLLRPGETKGIDVSGEIHHEGTGNLNDWQGSLTAVEGIILQPGETFTLELDDDSSFCIMINPRPSNEDYLVTFSVLGQLPP